MYTHKINKGRAPNAGRPSGDNSLLCYLVIVQFQKN
jgi:hypothetical protein